MFPSRLGSAEASGFADISKLFKKNIISKSERQKQVPFNVHVQKTVNH